MWQIDCLVCALVHNTVSRQATVNESIQHTNRELYTCRCNSIMKDQWLTWKGNQYQYHKSQFYWIWWLRQMLWDTHIHKTVVVWLSGLRVVSALRVLCNGVCFRDWGVSRELVPGFFADPYLTLLSAEGSGSPAITERQGISLEGCHQI